MGENKKKSRSIFAEQMSEISNAKPREVSELDHSQQALDEALRESFPASDPVAVSMAKPVALVKPKNKGKECPEQTRL